MPDNEDEHVADQEEVEEIEHVAEDRSGNDLPLVDRQPLLPLQELQHRFLLLNSAARPRCGERNSLLRKVNCDQRRWQCRDTSGRHGAALARPRTSAAVTRAATRAIRLS